MSNVELFSNSWILISFVVFFAAFVRGVSGFGFILILAPILILVINPVDVVVVTLILGLLSHILVICLYFKKINLIKILPIIISSAFGIPFGAWVITIVSPSTLKVIIGGVTVSSAILLSLGISKMFTREKLVSSVAGFISGILSSSTGMAGPPVVLFMHNQKWREETIQTSLAVYFTYATVLSLIALAVPGLVDMQIVMSTASLIPALLVGLGLGIFVFRRLNTKLFRFFTIAVIIVTGILGVLSGLEILS